MPDVRIRQIRATVAAAALLALLCVVAAPADAATSSRSRSGSPSQSGSSSRSGSSSSAGSASAQSMAVPAYIYPGSAWTQLDQAGSRVVNLVVMNPSSGPGTSPDPNYVNAVRAAQAAGISVMGYVYTEWGTRSLAAVEADVRNYYNWYGVNGVFFDQASTNCSYSPYYATLYSFVKAESAGSRVILNPGTQTSQCYILDADILLTFEGSDSQYVGSYSAPAWVKQYPASHFWHVIYSTATTSAVARAVALSKQRGAGYVFVTPDGLPNPYDTLPTGLYWSGELSDIG